MEGREEVVNVAVKGCSTQGMGSVFEEERVDKRTMLKVH